MYAVCVTHALKFSESNASALSPHLSIELITYLPTCHLLKLYQPCRWTHRPSHVAFASVVVADKGGHRRIVLEE